MAKQKILPRAPLISDIINHLDEKTREEVVSRFFDWIATAARMVENKGDAVAFASLLQYHAPDLIAVFKEAVKPEYQDLAENILSILGVRSHER